MPDGGNGSGGNGGSYQISYGSRMKFVRDHGRDSGADAGGLYGGMGRVGDALPQGAYKPGA